MKYWVITHMKFYLFTLSYDILDTALITWKIVFYFKDFAISEKSKYDITNHGRSTLGTSQKFRG